jgi:hypothetical protein
MTNIKCPHCGRDFVRRVSTAGVLEILRSVFYVYPFRCQLCDHRFLSFQRGVRYLRIKEDCREYDHMEINFPVTFSGGKVSGKGMLVNLSMSGCIFTTTADLATGMVMKLALQIYSSAPPIIVDAAVVVVRKTAPGTPSVEFLRWQETERARLRHFIRTLLFDRGVFFIPRNYLPE